MSSNHFTHLKPTNTRRQVCKLLKFLLDLAFAIVLILAVIKGEELIGILELIVPAHYPF